MSRDEEAYNDRKQIVIITGMSGSGKHTAFKAFEDLGYFCVDNLPTALVPRLIEMTIASGGKIDRLAVVVDVRLGESVADFEKLFKQLKELPFASQVLFFDASDQILAQRYSETRRMHPLARSSSLLDGFREEREAVSGIRAMADVIIDTSNFSIHDLKRFIYDRFREGDDKASLNVSLVSFGFKRGLPYNSDLVFDVRFLPNPHFVDGLKEQTGNDQEVIEYLNQFDEVEETLRRFTDLLEYLVPRYAREGKSYCTVGIGCTGGRHRSVRVANVLAQRLQERGIKVNLIHRDLPLE